MGSCQLRAGSCLCAWVARKVRKGHDRRHMVPYVQACTQWGGDGRGANAAAWCCIGSRARQQAAGAQAKQRLCTAGPAQGQAPLSPKVRGERGGGGTPDPAAARLPAVQCAG